MAKSKYEYVKDFEQHETCLLNTFIVVRIDGKGFSKFTALHDFKKPNDYDALVLMNEAAKAVMHEFDDIFLAYGQSDEYSFVFRKESTVYKRRKDKIISTVVSIFTAKYVASFQAVMNKELKALPSFDCRIVLYPDLKTLRDYFSWRQVDCHINNLYNTSFWMLVLQGKKSQKEAEEVLRYTLSDFKNELLFSQFNVNYSKLEPIFRKGSLIVRHKEIDPEKLKKMNDLANTENVHKVNKPRPKLVLKVLHDDLIEEGFWRANLNFLYE